MARRNAALGALGQNGERAVMVIATMPLAIRNRDVEHAFRPASDVIYLSGFEEPECILLLTTAHEKHRFVMFVRPRDPELERWDGARAGVEGAKATFGADEAYPITEFKAQLEGYLKGAEKLYVTVGEQPSLDREIIQVLSKLRKRSRRGEQAPEQIIDPALIVHEMRVIKDEHELKVLDASAAITAAAHERAMRVAKPGAFEYEVEAAIAHEARVRGAERLAYESIVGSGPNATVLHYRTNNRRIEEGDLVLVDAGVELNYYATDVTRTFPAGGRFSAEQKAVYEVVLRSQLAAIDATQTGTSIDSVHETALKVIAQGLIDLKIVTGSLDEVLEKKAYQPYYMHRTSHWLGMDVHDVGWYYKNSQSRHLAPGMVITIEPGLYIAADSAGAQVASRWHGIGVRIEDDVLVTAGAPRVITSQIPKDVNALETFLQSRST